MCTLVFQASIVMEPEQISALWSFDLRSKSFARNRKHIYQRHRDNPKKNPAICSPVFPLMNGFFEGHCVAAHYRSHLGEPRFSCLVWLATLRWNIGCPGHCPVCQHVSTLQRIRFYLEDTHWVEFAIAMKRYLSNIGEANENALLQLTQEILPIKRT